MIQLLKKKSKQIKGIEEETTKRTNQILDELMAVFVKYKIQPQVARNIRIDNVSVKGKLYPVIKNAGELINVGFLVKVNDSQTTKFDLDQESLNLEKEFNKEKNSYVG